MLLRLFEVARSGRGLDAELWISIIDSLLLTIPAVVVFLTLHEAAHAWVAWMLGDSTAKDRGRVSLNPLRHLDPAGTALMALVGFGWGRPVPIDPWKLRFGPNRGAALVGLAGPAVNLFAALVLAIPIRLKLVAWHSPLFYQPPFVQPGWEWALADILGTLIYVNLAFAALNLIPLPPLDGSKILGGLLPNRFAPWLMRYEIFGLVVVVPGLIGLVVADVIFRLGIVAGALLPLLNAASLVIVGRPLDR